MSCRFEYCVDSMSAAKLFIKKNSAAGYPTKKIDEDHNGYWLESVVEVDKIAEFGRHMSDVMGFGGPEDWSDADACSDYGIDLIL